MVMVIVRLCPVSLGAVMAWAVVLTAPLTLSAAAPVVSNVRAQQREGTKLVEITYDVADADGDALRVSVMVSDNGGATYTVPAAQFSGSGYGAGVMPGPGKQIVWNAGLDWYGRFSTAMRFRVMASDGRPPQEVPGMVWLEAGTFLLGSPVSEADRASNEGPQTTVTLTQGFWMGKHEVTQEEFLAVIGSNPSSFTGDLQLPVETVSWQAATNYCAKLTARERSAGRLPAGYEYRLPTEAQWEYACRAGTTTRFSYGDDPNYLQLRDYGWYGVNGAGATHRVGEKKPNPWGLVDMHGNVAEWCAGWYGAYPGGTRADWQGPASGSWRSYRGGGWNDAGRYCRSAQRQYHVSTFISNSVGLRVALVPSL